MKKEFTNLGKDKTNEFKSQLQKHDVWHLKDVANSYIGAINGKTLKFYPSIDSFDEFISNNDYSFIKTNTENEKFITLEHETLFLWTNDTQNVKNKTTKTPRKTHWAISAALEAFTEIEEQKQKSPPNYDKIMKNLSSSFGVQNWVLPYKKDLVKFAKNKNNPHLTKNGFLLSSDGKSCKKWWVYSGAIDFENPTAPLDTLGSAAVFAVNKQWKDSSSWIIFSEIIKKNWQVNTTCGTVWEPKNEYLSAGELLERFAKNKIFLQADSNKNIILNPSDYWLPTHFADIDHRPCRLPKLEQTQLNDPEKGLWEFWGSDAETLAQWGITARNPALDVQPWAVAIDFGTSSTVVAVETPTGGSELLRIGVRDFFQSVEPAHFENPTVLECLDWPAFHEAWSANACRPALDWDWMRAAHEAQANWRDNSGDTAVLASILPRLKQWVLRQGQQQQQSWSDRQGHTIDLPQHTERNPVRGQWPQVSAEDPFDPVELYAWYLGMAINWRGRGLHLNYHLSFPVKYPLEVKNRILASFRRGLLRSLPATLLEAQPDVLHRFTVEELATEPAAYAAAALAHLGVQPTDAGMPYAVFDFGGGTSDFDFGLLRWATEDEEDQHGCERVFEHLASSGDNFLGGENLLEHLVYATFRANLDELRRARVQFTLPLNAQPFPGSEAFIARTQAAQTNTIMLAAQLRPFMESEDASLGSQIRLDLLDTNGNKAPCELVLDPEALDALLAQRCRQGVEAFVAELAHIQDELPADSEVQVLLAGNGSRSRHIRALFDAEGELWPALLHTAFGDAPPAITVHPPLPMDASKPHAPTAKTGVALGLLRVVPGRNTLLLNRVHTAHDGQAPFGWFAGRMRRGQFQHQVQPDSPYGQWQDLGLLQQGRFHLYTTASPRARSGLAEGDAELRLHALQFPAAPAGATLFARPARPGVLELACAADAAELEAEATPTLTTVQLAQ